MVSTVDRPHAPGAPLADRSRRILTALVRHYIEGGEPVSSLWLARRGGFGLSSATVRHTLADLERRGYVRQPHTSAGRVPTDLGYRGYVDALLHTRRPAPAAHQMAARLGRAGTVEDLLANVSHELSRAVHNLGFALTPISEATAFQHIDFIAQGGTRVLVVLVAEGGQILHKSVDLGESAPPAALSQAAAQLNAAFTGWPLSHVRAEIYARLRQERTFYDALLARALRLARSTFEDLTPQRSLIVQGASLLLEEASQGPDRLPLETLRTLFTLIEEKDRLIRLLNQCIDGPGLTVVIGTEHAAPDLQNFSLVASTYFDGRQLGTIGVIGPRRMRYSRAIAAVDSVSRAVSRVLGGETDRPPSAYDRAHETGTA